MPRLSVCVIARNEAPRLPALIDSLAPLETLPFEVELILVDSASTDETAEIAESAFAQVIVLEDSPHLSPAAGRYVGTERASGDWILYLDGDMTLCEEFIPTLADLCSRAPATTGWVGQNRYIYDDGTTRENAKGDSGEATVVPHIGGAVLLPRTLVMEVGNWNPRLFSNEEIDLYSRIRGLGGCVRFRGIPMVRHNARTEGFLRRLVGLWIPGLSRGKMFYGPGQLVASRIQTGQLANLVRFFPYPFVLWGGLIGGAALWVLGRRSAAAALATAAATWVALARGPRLTVVYTGFLPQILFGLKQYAPDYSPRVQEVRQRHALLTPSRSAHSP